MVDFPFPLGVSQFTTMPWTFEEDLRNYAALGVDAIEVCEFKLTEGKIADQLGAVQAAAMSICSVQPSVRTMLPSSSQPVPVDRRDRLARFRTSMETIAPYAPGAVFVTNTGPAPNGNLADTIARVVADHKELAAIAADNGVRIALEPLNPVSLNQESAIWTYSQALNIVEEVGADHVGICVDVWNLWQDCEFVADLSVSAERVFLLQVSDWRTPRSAMDRRSVGTGDIPIGELLHAVYDAGYRGPCVLEIFSQDVADSLYDTDLRDVLGVNRNALNRAWQTQRGG
jgi:sugar phosphate isomerase/epimerase